MGLYYIDQSVLFTTTSPMETYVLNTDEIKHNDSMDGLNSITRHYVFIQSDSKFRNNFLISHSASQADTGTQDINDEIVTEFRTK